jgi:hypothetical protein
MRRDLNLTKYFVFSVFPSFFPSSMDLKPECLNPKTSMPKALKHNPLLPQLQAFDLCISIVYIFLSIDNLSLALRNGQLWPK